MHTPSPLLISLTLFAMAVWGLAFWRGGAAERWAATILAINVVAVLVVFEVWGRAGQFIGLLVQLSLDGAAALALLLVLLRYGRPWLGIAMLLQAAQFTLQSVYLVGELQKDYWHVLANNLNFIAIHLALAAGTAQHWLRVRRARAPKT